MTTFHFPFVAKIQFQTFILCQKKRMKNMTILRQNWNKKVCSATWSFVELLIRHNVLSDWAYYHHIYLQPFCFKSSNSSLKVIFSCLICISFDTFLVFYNFLNCIDKCITHGKTTENTKTSWYKIVVWYVLEKQEHYFVNINHNLDHNSIFLLNCMYIKHMPHSNRKTAP